MGKQEDTDGTDPDEVLRRMLSTPPQPDRPTKKKKKAKAKKKPAK